MVKPLSEREIQLHCARVYIAEAKRRRGTQFAKTLLIWAANARRRAGEKEKPAQGELFR